MESDGQMWIREMREIKFLLEQLGHYLSGGPPMRCQFCGVLAGILSIRKTPCPKGPGRKEKETP